MIGARAFGRPVARRVALTFLVAAVATVAALSWPAPESPALGAADAIGTWALKLKGNGFERDAQNDRVTERSVRGAARLVVTRTPGAPDPRQLHVEVRLDAAMRDSLLDHATPTPALAGDGILVGDSITVIGAGQANFVNAVTLRFVRNGKRVDGWWLASFPGDDPETGFVAGAGVSFRGKRLKLPKSAKSRP